MRTHATRFMYGMLEFGKRWHSWYRLTDRRKLLGFPQANKNANQIRRLLP